ncbi:hypothetical protein HID58_007126, partial [Brassica napus]
MEDEKPQWQWVKVLKLGDGLVGIWKREKMEGEEEVSIKELASNLTTYKEQLQQVRQLLSEDPRNSEYADMEKELKEWSLVQPKAVECRRISEEFISSILVIVQVIALTEELLATAKQNEISLSDAGATSDSPDLLEDEWLLESPLQTFGDSTQANDPIHEGKFPIGTKVQAVFSEDGEWYEATVEAHTLNGYYVSYNESCSLVSQKIAKRKKIHAFKSKARQEQLEVAQNKKQNAWQQFQTTKAKTKKVGFYTGRKKESIFKSPEDPFGKVVKKREKHLHLKSGNAEGTD